MSSSRTLRLASALALMLTAGAVVLHPGTAGATTYLTYYVSPSGSDTNNGLSAATPFATLDHARAVVRGQIPSMTGDIVVNFAGGEYPFTTPTTFTSADSPTAGNSIIYQAAAGQTPVFTGATPVTSWTPMTGSIYAASLPGVSSLRDLWVNGQRAPIARSAALTRFTGAGTNNGDVGTYTFPSSPLPSWALSAESTTRVPPTGLAFTTGSLPSTFDSRTNPGDLELTEQVGFSYHVLGLTGVTAGSGFNQAVLQQPMGAIAWSEPRGWGSSFDDPSIAATAPGTYYLQNAFDYLTPGTFSFNSATHTLYYDLRAGESISTAVVRAPLAESLVTLAGSSTSDRVHNIRFNGITFGYTNWGLMNVAGSRGASTVQGNAMYDKYYADAGGQNNWHEVTYLDSDLAPAAVQTSNASNLTFDGDTFVHLGSGGLNLGNDTNTSTVRGSVFTDISGSAITVGDPKNTYLNDGDFPTGVEGLPTGDTITDNVLYNNGAEFPQTVPVMAYYSQQLSITHNVIANAAYTGISLGWGFNYFAGFQTGVTASNISGNNVISHNIVYNVMQSLHDGASIYVDGLQPGSKIDSNVIDRSGGQAIYTDQGSNGWEIAHNVMTNYAGVWWYVWGPDAHVANIYAHDNFGDVVSGSEGSAATVSTSTINQATWSRLGDATVANAGVEPAYAGLVPAGLATGLIRGRIEAETGTLGGRATISADGYASGGKIVAQLDTVGTSVSYAPLAAANAITVHYASVNSGHIGVYVNGVRATSLNFTSTGSWLTSFGDATVTVNIPENATVRFQNDSGDVGLNLDYLTFTRQQSGNLEAESQVMQGRAAVLGGVGVYNDYLVAYLDTPGDGITFPNVAAASTITARYASNATGHESIYVNGVKVGVLNFWATGGWYTGWRTAAMTVSIPAGATLTIQNDAGDTGFNLDMLTLS